MDNEDIKRINVKGIVILDYQEAVGERDIDVENEIHVEMMFGAVSLEGINLILEISKKYNLKYIITDFEMPISAILEFEDFPIRKEWRPIEEDYVETKWFGNFSPFYLTEMRRDMDPEFHSLCNFLLVDPRFKSTQDKNLFEMLME
jgi:hypothetical protein